MRKKKMKAKKKIRHRIKANVVRSADAECGLCQKEIKEGDGYCDECKGQI